MISPVRSASARRRGREARELLPRLAVLEEATGRVSCMAEWKRVHVSTHSNPCCACLPKGAARGRPATHVRWSLHGCGTLCGALRPRHDS